ncbi:GSCOCG00013462001-RA-CDS [Cotesia congregata]|nr:GSCOCG00013462001-RA-CDS [Cotesia congregata]
MPKIKREKVYGRREIEAALEDVKRGIPIRTASRSHNVPRSTLYSKLTNKTSLEAKPGPATYLTQEQEHQVIDWVFYLRDRGFAITKNQLLDSVRDMIVALGRKTPFKDNRPGRHWFEAFLRRHPDAAEKVIQNLSSRMVEKKSLRHWFLEVKQMLESLQLLELGKDRVYNLKVEDFLMKGQKKKKVDPDDGKERVKVFFAGNADGDLLPPMLAFGYQRIPGIVSKNLPKDWKVSGESTEIFREYISSTFYPWLVSKKIKLPVVLYIDGSANLSMSVVNYCRKVQIELVGLCPDATHLLQPIEQALLKPMTKSWNDSPPVKKETFAPTLNTELLKIDKMAEELKMAFKTCGLCPFSIEVVNYGLEVNLEVKEEKIEEDDNIPEIDNDNNVKSSLNHSLTKNYSSEEYLRFLEFFERHLAGDLLKSFRENLQGSVFVGEERNKGLFEFWVNIKKKCFSF